MANKLALMLGGKKSSADSQEEKSNVETKEQEPGRDREAEDAPAPAKTTSAPKLAGLKIAKLPSTPSSRPAPSKSAVGTRAGAGSSESGDGDSGTQAPEEMTLDDLDNSEEPGTSRPGLSRFADEIPATQPIRDLEVIEGEEDEAIRKGMKQFAELIDGVYTIVDDAEMLGNVIRSIMIELKNNPQYMKLVAPEDVRTWIRAMRENMGLQQIKKEAKKSSRAGGTKKNLDMDMLADLESLGDI